MDQQPTADEHAPPRLDAVATGVAHVDAIQDEVIALDQRPVSEHVAVFERAHDELRRALDASAAD